MTFLTSIEWRFRSMRRYEDRRIRAKALDLIPVLLLEQRAQERMRSLQKQVKKGLTDDINISIQEFLILELLAWFKESFFEWVDSPECDYCDNKTKFSHMSNDPKLLVDTDRVEMHRCVQCNKFTSFARYENLDILLETCEGRCGEWANVFTLMCIAMGWEARFVCDETDHVWTEVYSIAQKRWLHCDPCENVCDTPLMYETGWGKQLSYVIAYSYDDIQDVSWRYTADHNKLHQNRNKCSENELINTMIRLREERYKELTKPRRDYLTRRLLLELVELMQEKKPTDTEKVGRTSGSLAWRLQRGETQINQSKIWSPNANELSVEQMTIRFSPTLNQYERVVRGNVTEIKRGWENGVLMASGIFRKEEKDWKNVYLTREETASEGEIQWKLSTENTGKLIKWVFLKFHSKVFENGQVDVQICGKNKCISIPNNIDRLESDDFNGSDFIIIKVRLHGGRGACAWQHAQLFRQSLDSNDYPFSVTITF